MIEFNISCGNKTISLMCGSCLIVYLVKIKPCLASVHAAFQLYTSIVIQIEIIVFYY